MHGPGARENINDTDERDQLLEKTSMDVDVEGNVDLEADREIDDQVKPAGWRSLFNFTSKSHTLPLSLALILSVASGIVIPVLAIFLGKVFDSFTDFGAGHISGSSLVEKVSVYGIALVGLGSASGLLNGGYFMLWLVFGELQAKSVRDRLFDGMLEKDMEWYDMRKAGIDALIPRLQTHIRELQMATSQPLGFVVQYAVTTIAALGLAFYTAWSLTLVTLAFVPISAVFLAWISARMQPSIDAQIVELTQASKLANNSISAIDTVKCFNGQDFEVWQYSTAVKRAATYYLTQAQANALQIGFVRIMTLGMFVQGFWYGSHLVDAGKKNPGQVLTAFWACLMATQAIEQILPQMIVLEKGRAAGATLKAIYIHMERGRRITRMVGRRTPAYCDGDIEVRKVSFAYPSRPEQLALNSATFFFPAGETTFVIGRSGSGKSTLGNLLMRFYTPASGDIFIDGNSIPTLDINWLRNNITLVQQQSILFNETIFKNIAFGRRDHSRVRKEEVKRSIETASLQHTVSDLPQGLETLVGVGGNSMSGGQKQRVAIARARLRDTPILILDEATSALDQISRSLVMDAIRDWRRGKTTIIITHDISQILQEDYAYIMDKGVIVQEGYRHALGNESPGPFGTLLQPIVEFTRPIEHEKSHDVKNVPSPQVAQSESLPSSKVSKNSMDIEYLPRRRYIPSVFGPLPDESRSRRPSKVLIPPLSPVACHMRPMSINTAVSFYPRRKLSQPIEPMDSLTPALLGSPDALEMSRSIGRDTLLSYRKRSKTEDMRSSRSARTSIEKTSIAPRLKHGVSEGTRKLREAEKRRRISPVNKILFTVWPTLTCRKRFVLLCGFLCAAIHAAATPVFSWVFSQLLATFFLTSSRSEMALKWSLSVLGVAIGDAIASYLMHYLLESCGQAWIDTLRVQAMKRILDQPRAWFDRDRNSLSRLTECLDRNAEEMRNLVGRFAGFVFVAVTMMMIAIVWSLIICWKLTLVGLASAPFLYALTRIFEAVSGKWEGKSNDAGEIAGSIFAETFSNIRTVRALTLEGYFHQKYAKATDNAMIVGLKRSAYSGFFFGLSDSGIVFVTALIFYYGAVLASSKAFTTQDILTVFTMLLFSIANANAIVAFIPQINSSRDTATRLLRLSTLPYKSSHEHTGNIRLSSPGPINFASLTFAYPSRPTHPVLSSFTLTLPSSTTTAIAGASGSGKSTIASLLLGLYPSPPQTLFLSSLDIRTLHLPTLRTLISIVPQSPTLFPATIAQNIAYALPEFSPLSSIANIRSAAQAAGIDDFIVSLSRGYDTPIGEGGTGLSGGQAQRIAIARAVARRPRLLVMDEATSGLDGESRRLIRETVMVLGKRGIGVLVITHEGEMMRGCEGVVVVGNRGVVEKGGFEELITRKDGELRRLLGGGL